jgi:DNA primase
MIAAGLVVEGEGGRCYDRFRDRVTIPIRAIRGNLIAFGGRTVGDDTPKYLNSPETALFAKSQVLYALDRAARAFAKSDRAIVVEGYFDCLALHVAGFTETVATLGTSLSEHHARELARKVPRVVVCFDGDDAGRTAAVSAVRTLLAADLDVAVLLLPEGQDPDDVVRRAGATAFARLVDGALPVGEFLVGQLGRGRQERRDNLMRVIEIADACPNPVRRYALREALAQAAGVPTEQLGAVASPRVLAADSAAVSFLPPGESALLRAILLDLPAEERRAAVAAVPAAALDHPATILIIKCLSERVERGAPLEISDLASDIDDREVRRILAALEHEVPPTGVEHLKLIMRELCEKQRQKRLADLSLEIARAERQNEPERLAQLLHEKSALIRKTTRS